MKKKKGFTLIEMLIVIILVGIILAVAIPSVVKLINRNSEDAYNVQMKLIESAMELYVLKNKGSFNDSNVTCYKMSYNTLKEKGDLKENDITCSGDILIYKTTNDYEYEYNLTCKNKKGISFSEKVSKTDNCVIVN